MKNLQKLLFGSVILALVGISFAFTSFEKNSLNDNLELFAFDFPENTLVEINGNTIHFDLPDGYSIVGITPQQTFFQSEYGASGSITCTCLKEDGGCSPAKSGDTYLCVMSSCSNCEKTNSIAGSNYTFTDIIIINPDRQGPYSEAQNLDSKIVLPQKFINFELFLKPIKEFHDRYSTINDNKRKIVFYDLYGYIVPLDVPFSSDTYSAYISNDYNNTGVNCNCNEGKDCPKENVPLVGVYCDATNCKSCTLTASIKTPETGDINQIEIFNHRISIR